MQVKLFLLTVVEDGAGQVISESRAPLPATFTQGEAVAAAVVPIRERRSGPSTEPSRFDAARFAPRVDERSQGMSLPDEPVTAQPDAPLPDTTKKSAPIPLFENDPDVLSMFGNKVAVYKEQRSHLVLEDGQPVLHTSRQNGNGANGNGHGPALIPLDDAVFGDGGDED